MDETGESLDDSKHEAEQQSHGGTVGEAVEGEGPQGGDTGAAAQGALVIEGPGEEVQSPGPEAAQGQAASAADPAVAEEQASTPADNPETPAGAAEQGNLAGEQVAPVDQGLHELEASEPTAEGDVARSGTEQEATERPSADEAVANEAAEQEPTERPAADESAFKEAAEQEATLQPAADATAVKEAAEPEATAQPAADATAVKEAAEQEATQHSAAEGEAAGASASHEATAQPAAEGESAGGAAATEAPAEQVVPAEAEGQPQATPDEVPSVPQASDSQSKPQAGAGAAEPSSQAAEEQTQPAQGDGNGEAAAATAAREPTPPPVPPPARPSSGRPSSRPVSANLGAEQPPGSNASPAPSENPPAQAAPAAATAQGGEGGDPAKSARSAMLSSGRRLSTSSMQQGGPDEEEGLVLAAQRAQQRALENEYDAAQFVQAQDLEQELPADVVKTAHILSLDALRRNNIWYIENDKIVTAVGSNVVFLRLPTMEQQYLPSLDGGSVGAVAVHPTRKFLAVAEHCRYRSPNIYIYSYPDLKLRRVLRNGTERAYSSLAFNERGDQLASVGSWPDYLLTLWSWETEAIVLRSKAFSQDVYTLRFSPYFEGSLTTSGTGHIRFWKMASTFTGLKLQGQIGKFGNVELSDISAFVEMPDGKVLSSTEVGDLLMWDGGLIKAVIKRSHDQPCHNGQVDVLLLSLKTKVILSGGSDGYVRIWDFNKINEAEPGEDSHLAYVDPTDEVLVSPGVHVRGLLWEQGHWLVLDGTGAFYKVDLPEGGSLSSGAKVTKLLQFHAGGVMGLITSPVAHVAMTAGQDGSVRIFDYAKRSLEHTARFSQPATLLIGLDSGHTVAAVGFKDGVVRLIARKPSGLQLLAAHKPHQGAVTSLALSPDATSLASSGEDGTVFFFKVKECTSLEPICFTKLPAVATCADWASDGSKLMLGLHDGRLLELQPPQGSVDTEKTFEMALPYRTCTLLLPKPKKAAKVAKGDDKAGADAGQGEGGMAAETQAAPLRTSLDGEELDEEGKEKQAQEQEEEREEEEAESVDDDAQHEVLTLSYIPNSGHAFHVTLGGRWAGHVWQGSFQDGQEAIEAVPAFDTPSTAPTSFFRYSRNGRYQLMGTCDGVVRMQPASGPGTPPSGKFWQGSLHDVHAGRVSAVALSFDEKYLLSAAWDGSIYLQELHIPGVSPSIPLPSSPEALLSDEEGPKHVADITNPSDYTIEKAKQKAEEDAKIAAAESKKMGVRDYLHQIRTEFEALVAENAAKPEAERLPRSAFEIDVGLREMIAEETAKRIEEAGMEVAWETAKRKLALKKLKAFFFDHIEVERIVLYGVRVKHYVTTFRTAALSEDMQHELELAKEAEAARAAARSRAVFESNKAQNVSGRPSLSSGSARQDSKQTVDEAKLTKADQRRLARKKREAEWHAFNLTRPDEKYENEADVQAIYEAEQNMGDYKLKSDQNYVIPEEDRMTPQRKRHQMLLLEEAMHSVRMDFNHRFLALREVKRKVITEINSRVQQLEAIHEQLGRLAPASREGFSETPFDIPPMLTLRPEEVPEDREKVSQEDVEEHVRQKEAAKSKAAASKLGGFGGHGGPAAASTPPSNQKASDSGSKQAAAQAGKAGEAAGGGGGGGAPTGEEALAKMMAAVPLSELEKQLQAYQRRKLEQQAARLHYEVLEMADTFDDALSTLRREKLGLEAQIKLCEIRQLVHAQELSLLQDFDKREVVFIEKRTAKMVDRNDILVKINDCNAKLDSKRVEIEQLLARRHAVAAEFDAAVPDTEMFKEQLAKIFNRKIKRSKKKAAGGRQGDDDESEEESEDGEEEDDEEEGDDDDDEGEEACPPGCDQNLYERVCDLREKRLDEEELIAEFTKTIETLRKEKEALVKKQKVLEMGLAAINQDITEFQKEKQQALNQIDVIVNLKMHQIEYLVDRRIPDDTSAGLVFSSRELERLKNRIHEMDQERLELKAKHKELKKEHLQLLKDKAAKDQRVAELEGRAHDVQMLKFGQIINLDLLDTIGASRGTEELKEEIRKQEEAYTKELAEWDKKIAERTNELMALTAENTRALNAVSEMTAAQRGLESGLTKTRKTMFVDPVLQRRQEVEERDSLVQLVNAQATEIERVKAQILALRSKNTSVYT